jgi:hypothetical protein
MFDSKNVTILGKGIAPILCFRETIFIIGHPLQEVSREAIF